MNLLDLILVRLELGQYSIMYTGISVLFVLCLFNHICLVSFTRFLWSGGFLAIHRSMM